MLCLPVYIQMQYNIRYDLHDHFTNCLHYGNTTKAAGVNSFLWESMSPTITMASQTRRMKNMLTVILIHPEMRFQLKTWHRLTSAGYFRWRVFAPRDSLYLWNITSSSGEKQSALHWCRVQCFQRGVKGADLIGYDSRQLLPRLWYYPNLAPITARQVKK